MTEDESSAETAGNFIYDTPLTEGLAGIGLAEFLSDVCYKFFQGRFDDSRLSNATGVAYDVILLLLDVAVKPEEMDSFRQCAEDVAESYDEQLNPQPEAAD